MFSVPRALFTLHDFSSRRVAMLFALRDPLLSCWESRRLWGGSDDTTVGWECSRYVLYSGRACGTTAVLGAPTKLNSSASSRSTEIAKPFLTPFLRAVLSCWSCCCCSGSPPRPMATPLCLFSLALALFKSGYFSTSDIQFEVATLKWESGSCCLRGVHT